MAAETFFTYSGTADDVTLTIHNGDPFRDQLQVRGYRFVTEGVAAPVWTLTIKRTDTAAAKAEADWIKNAGISFVRA